MTVLEHIKHLAVGLTPKEKRDLTEYLTESQQGLPSEKPQSLRGDWSVAFPTQDDVENDLKEIRAEWQKEWQADEFVG